MQSTGNATASDFSANVRVIRVNPKLHAPKSLAVALPGGLHY